ncbi:MAG: hypothetical protein AABZ74_16825, partial [Cyanobacteriota bacterium]
MNENNLNINIGNLYDSGFKVFFLENNYILTSFYESGFKVINLDTGDCTKVINFEKNIIDFQVTNDKKQLFLHSGYNIYGFNLTTFNEITFIENDILSDKNYLKIDSFFENIGYGVKFIIDSNNKYLIVSGGNGILIWSLEEKKVLKREFMKNLTKNSSRCIWNICLDIKNEKLAIRYHHSIEDEQNFINEESILVLSIPSLEVIHDYKINDDLYKIWDQLGDNFRNFSTEFNPLNQNQIFFMIPFEDNLYILDLETGKIKNSFVSINNEENISDEDFLDKGIYSFNFSPDFEWLLTHSNDYITIWDLKNEKTLNTIKSNYNSSINNDKSLIALFPNKSIGSCIDSIKNEVLIYSLEKDEIIQTFKRQLFTNDINRPFGNLVPIFVSNDRKNIIIGTNSIINTFNNRICYFRIHFKIIKY